MRESVSLSYQLLFESGPQLPWLTVLRLTQPEDAGLVTHPLLPLALLGFAALVAYGFWKVLGRREVASVPEPA